ncbi:ABC transporter permease [Halopelagius longus]|uniref:ABC transporter permease n=1 Tax=Halopelagius longus TaxID=1236180 RepID=A0A1H1AYU8_9EURY|nr:ABC transporter permease [Halopelagius longus]RDI70569.1 ABC transporter permease [Halopelagius longus]SDQ44844.1 nucleoside ABC transporter membrane protein [Halopelagius longus]
MSVKDVVERLVGASAFERFLISGAALLLSIAVGFVLILAAGRMTTCGTAAATYFGVGFCYDPFLIYDRLFLGAFGNLSANPLNGQFATTLSETTILMFTGVAVAVAFRAGIFNIGTQGQLVVGGLVTAVALPAVATTIPAGIGAFVLLPFGLLLGALTGGIYGAIPGALKAYADANEVITTIMLNFVATSVALYLAQSHFKDPESFATQTVAIPDRALFPSVVFNPRDDFSLVAFGLAVVLLVAVYLILERTSFGYDLRTSGLQAEAAEYGGVDAARTVVASMTFSGALAGIGGAIYVLMVLGNFQPGVPDYGFDGITVSILAGNNPLGVGLAALLFGVLKSGSIVVDVATDVPPQLVGVLRGLIILFVAMPEFFRLIGRRIWTFEDESTGRPVTDGGVGGESDE